MKTKHYIYLIIGIFILGLAGILFINPPFAYKKNNIGDKIDHLNGVHVKYNGNVGNVSGRNTTADGYNLGLKYQCVEFVKRYYYEYFNHKMPDSYGHAKDFFDHKLADGQYNRRRNLVQYTNKSQSKPKVNDLIIFGATPYNKYGHVAIISKVTDNTVEIIQQNPGPTSKSRATFPLVNYNGKWEIKKNQTLGWLRKN